MFSQLQSILTSESCWLFFSSSCIESITGSYRLLRSSLFQISLLFHSTCHSLIQRLIMSYLEYFHRLSSFIISLQTSSLEDFCKAIICQVTLQTQLNIILFDKENVQYFKWLFSAFLNQASVNLSYFTITMNFK